MYRPTHNLLRCLGVTIAACAMLTAMGTTYAAAEDAYTPTMKDMRSIQNALERYLKGGETHDPKLQGSAFWDDALIVQPLGQKMTVKQMMELGDRPPSDGAPGPAGAGTPPGGPPPGGMMMMTPPSCDPKMQKPEKGWELWHIMANSAFEFQSATRVRHHAYWFAVCPSGGPNNGAGLAVIGPPGHYDDVLEKRNGEWRLISRVIALNEKYPKK